MSLCRVLLLGLLLSRLAVSLPAAAGNLPGLGDILEEVGEGPIEVAHHAEVAQGGLVVSELTEVSERELAVGAACLVSRPPAEVLAPLLAPRPLGTSEHVEEVVRVSDPRAPTALVGLRFGDGAHEEARHYVSAEPGYGLNLSNEEIARFAGIAVDAPELVPRVEEALQAVLTERLAGYVRQGLAGGRGYARGGGRIIDPARELHRSFAAAEHFDLAFPGFARLWSHYPDPSVEVEGEAFFWSRARIDERPAFFLSHRIHDIAADRGIVARRSFYISHFFDAAFEIAGVASVREGRLFFFVRRVWVDRWNGWSSMKRRVGHRLIKGELRAQIEAERLCD